MCLLSQWGTSPSLVEVFHPSPGTIYPWLLRIQNLILRFSRYRLPVQGPPKVTLTFLFYVICWTRRLKRKILQVSSSSPKRFDSPILAEQCREEKMERSGFLGFSKPGYLGRQCLSKVGRKPFHQYSWKKLTGVSRGHYGNLGTMN